MIEARRLVITGVVQGVGFRHHAAKTAIRLNIAGWICNRQDGSVETVIAGTPEAVAAMIHWARVGPPTASVSQVFVQQSDDTDHFDGFEQRPTL